jgi:trypsin-like peptidase
MHRHVGYLLLLPFGLLAYTHSIQAACIDPAQLAHSTVSITRYFDDAEREINRGRVGVRGTGWFLSPTTIVTAEHVTAGMNLSTEVWKPIEIVDGDGSQLISARIQRLAGAQAERLAVIELQRAVSAARIVEVRGKPLMPEEQVMTLAYLEGRLHPVTGRFVLYGDDGKLAGMALLEVYEGDNRLVIDHGASGAPVVDCDGRVAAVVSNVFTQSIVFASREIRISTAWGMPNVLSVPVQVLDDSSKSNETEVLQRHSSAAIADDAGGSDIVGRPPNNRVLLP